MRIFFILSSLSLVSVIESQSGCGKNQECITASECKFYTVEREILDNLRRGTRDYTRQLNKLKDIVCNSKERKVCCDIISSDTGSPESEDPSFRPSVWKEECGVQGGHAGFIRGGNDTKIGEYPFLALLGKDSKKGRGKFWNCGGTLINNWYVLSAAHCGNVKYARLGEWNVVDPDQIQILRGACNYYNDISKERCVQNRRCRNSCQKKDPTIDCEINYSDGSKTCSESHQDIPVAELKIHPDYGKTPIGLAINDIMLVKLSRAAVYNEFVKPVCLPPNIFNRYAEPGSPRFDHNKPTVVGWGMTGTEKDEEIKIVSSAKQQYLKVPAVSNSDCLRQYKDVLKHDLTGNIMLEQHLCAGGEEGKDSCKGDSGGPLIAREDDISPWLLIGVVSGGTSRCGIGAPGIFTRVTNYDQWITDNMI